MKHRPKGNAGAPMDRRKTLEQIREVAIIGSAAIVAGALVGLLLRLTNHHWSTPVVAVPLAVAGFLIDTMVGVVASLATASALGAGAARSIQEREKGGDARRRELARPTLIRLAWNRWRLGRARTQRIADGRLALGAGPEGIVSVKLGTSQGGVHGFIPGKTGSGKTVTAAALLEAHILSGAAAVVVDPKGDDYLEQVLRESAQIAGVPFCVVEPGVSERGYNVASRGDDSAIAEKILSTHKWSEPHYRSTAQRAAQAAVAVLRAAGKPLSLKNVGHYMHPDRLESLAASSGAETDRVRELVADTPRRMLDDLAGARSRIAQLTESGHGPWLDPEAHRCIDLAQVVAHRGVVHFRLDGAEHPVMTKLLAAAIVLDLIGVSKGMQRTDQKAVLFFDEFAALAAENVSSLLERGRSSGLSVLLATQAMADLEAVRGDRTLGSQVIGNCEYTIVHHIPDPDDAELFAGLSGTYATWTQTEVFSPVPLTAPEARSKIPTREYNVHPDVFKNLKTGEAVVISRSNPGDSRLIRVWAPDGMGLS